MQEPRLYGALHEAHRQVEQELAKQNEGRALTPQEPSGHYYGDLRTTPEVQHDISQPAGRGNELESEAALRPTNRSWPMQTSMASQHDAANIWVRQNNDALSDLAVLRQAARNARMQEQQALERDDPDLEM